MTFKCPYLHDGAHNEVTSRILINVDFYMHNCLAFGLLCLIQCQISSILKCLAHKCH